MQEIISSLSPWLYVPLGFLLVEALKVYVEIWNRPQRRESTTDLTDVTVLIATHNGADTLRTTIEDLRKAGFQPDRILVINDASTDATVDILNEMGINYYTVRHMGKVGAINFGIHRISTKYVLLLDDDTQVGNARIPTGLLDQYDAVAFKVIPDRRGRAGIQGSNLVSALQRYEYLKSMEIGRRFQDAACSIACVSGAVGLFKRERLQQLHHAHRGAFEGEDLERTLLELLNNGRVVFADEPVWTVVPDSVKGLMRQRLFGWYPALYHMVPIFLKLLCGPGRPLRLRFEMLYNLFVVFGEPFRVFSLFYLLFTLRWPDLVLLYLSYVLLELYPFHVIRPEGSSLRRLMVLFLYPTYNLLQMNLRQMSMYVWLKKRFMTKEMKPRTELDRKWSIAATE